MPSAPFVLHRDILYRRVWSKPAKAVARNLGISIASLIRICEKLAIPHPTKGYWERHEAGLENPAPLPPAGDGPTKHEFDLDKSVRFHRPSQEARQLIRAEYRRNPQVRASNEAPSHPLVVAAAPRLGENDYIWKPPFGCLEVVTGPECRERALRLMDSLLCALDRRKFRVEVRDEDRGTGATILGEFVRFGLHESVERVYPEDVAPDSPEVTWTYRRTGSLRLLIYAGPAFSGRRRWRDTAKRPIEQVLNSFIRGLITVADAQRAERRARTSRGLGG